MPVETPSLEKLAKPEDEEEVCHDTSCSRCHQKVRGVRLRCLNCPSYNLCISCLAKRGQGHQAEKQWPNKSHVFDIIHTHNRHFQASKFVEQIQLETTMGDEVGEDYDLDVVLSLSLIDQGPPEGSGSSGSSTARSDHSEASHPAKRPKH